MEKNSDRRGGSKGQSHREQKIKWFQINMAETQGHSDFIND